MDIKQMKNFVSQELKGLKQEHRLLSLRRFPLGGGEGRGPLFIWQTLLSSGPELEVLLQFALRSLLFWTVKE